MRILKAAVVGAVALAGAAQADVIFSEGNIPGDTSNVLYGNCEGNVRGPAANIQGCLNDNRAQLVDLGTTGDALDNQGVGQANLIAADGSFDDLTIALAGGRTFSHLIFNIDVLNVRGASNDGFATFVVSLLGEPDVTRSFAIRENGENFFTLRAINGEAMTALRITSDVELSNVNQIRIGGVRGPGGGVDPVPEPAMLGLLGLGLLGLGAARRRRA